MTNLSDRVESAVTKIEDSSDIAEKFADISLKTEFLTSKGLVKPLGLLQSFAENNIVKLTEDAQESISRIVSFSQELFVPYKTYTENKFYFIEGGVVYTPIDIPYTAGADIFTDISLGKLTVLQGLTGFDIGLKGSKLPRASDTIIAFSSLLPVSQGGEINSAINAVLEIGQKVKTLGYKRNGDGGHGEYFVAPPGTGIANGGSIVQMENGNQLILILSDCINVRQFGAVGDLITDDMQSFQNAFLAARGTPYTVVAYGSFRLSAPAGGIHVYNSFDFSGALLKCDTVDDEAVEYHRQSMLFMIKGNSEEVTVNQSEFIKGETYIPSLANYIGQVSVSSGNIECKRWLSGSSQDIKTREANFVTSGLLSDELIFDYTGHADFKVKVNTDNRFIDIHLGQVDLNDAKIMSVIQCTKNNVNIHGLQLHRGELSCYETIGIADCSNVEIYNVDAPQVGTPTVANYLLVITCCYNTLLRSINNRDGWSAINGNFFRGLTIKDSKVYSMGAHAFSYDLEAVRTTFYRSITLHGGGYLRLTDCKHLRGREEEPYSLGFILIRMDYGASFDGKVTIKNLSVYLQEDVRVYTLVEDYLSPNNHEYISKSPEIEISGVTIECDYEHSMSNPMLVRAYWNSKTDITNLSNKRFMDKFTVENFNVRASRKNTSLFDVNLLLTKTDFDMSLATDENFERGRTDWFFKDINFYPARPLASSIDAVFFPVEVYNLSKIGVVQNITISNSDYVGVQMTTPFDVMLKLEDQVCVNFYRDQITQQSDFSSLIEVNNCKILNAGGTNSELEIPIVASCVEFDYMSYLYGVNPNEPEVLGYPAVFQIVSYSSCSARKPRFSNESIRSDFKSKILSNFKDSVFYEV